MWESIFFLDWSSNGAAQECSLPRNFFTAEIFSKYLSTWHCFLALSSHYIEQNIFIKYYSINVITNSDGHSLRNGRARLLIVEEEWTERDARRRSSPPSPSLTWLPTACCSTTSTSAPSCPSRSAAASMGVRLVDMLSRLEATMAGSQEGRNRLNSQRNLNSSKRSPALLISEAMAAANISFPPSTSLSTMAIKASMSTTTKFLSARWPASLALYTILTSREQLKGNSLDPPRPRRMRGGKLFFSIFLQIRRSAFKWDIRLGWSAYDVQNSWELSWCWSWLSWFWWWFWNLEDLKKGVDKGQAFLIPIQCCFKGSPEHTILMAVLDNGKGLKGLFVR